MNFIPELDLAEEFYHECVKSILAIHFPNLPYSAALLGEGSGVLGFDTALSRDHDWGPRLQIFVPEGFEDIGEIYITLDKLLPKEFLEYSVRFKYKSDKIEHHVEIWTLSNYLKMALGVYDLNHIELIDWLNFPENKLLYLIRGKVFFDGMGSVEGMRSFFSYYPKDIWYYLLSSQWHILAEEMPFVGRCGEVQDEIGSRLIASRQVYRIIKMAFLLEKKYAPYNKWLGTAFKKLSSFNELNLPIQGALSATDWQTRERCLNDAYKVLIQNFNKLNILGPIPLDTVSFHDRPYSIVNVPSPYAIRNLIIDEKLKDLPIGIGGIDQTIDNVDALVNTDIAKNYNHIFS